MALGDALSYHLPFPWAIAVGVFVALLGTFITMPRIIYKLHGAQITGRDINKPGRPVVAEMGGIGVFLGFNAGVFVVVLLYPLPAETQNILLAALITAAGAAMTGVMDDLVELRQRFKAFIPLVFAAPLGVYLADYTVAFPLLGAVDFWIFYPLLLVPLGITCAANGFNMIEGYNGLGAGMGIVMAAALSILSVLNGHLEALIVLLPLLGALCAFLWFNRYPARVFPGDTMTLLVGATLAAGAMLGKVEFWGALLFVPHVIEFFLKARGAFDAENFAKVVHSSERGPPLLTYEGSTESLTHVVLKRIRATEPRVTMVFCAVEAALAVGVIVAFVTLR